MNNTKAVIFDLGRVLVSIDTERPKFAAMMRSMGIPPKEAFDRYWFAREVRQHMTGEIDSHRYHQIVLERFHLDLEYNAFVEAWGDLFEPVPGMRELFEAVADRYTVGLLSDTDPVHWDAVKRTAPWVERVEKPTLSFEVGVLKPHPDIFARAAENCGCALDECLFIDDFKHNVDGARFIGMPAIRFTDAEKLRKDLTGLGVM